eukprot:1034299-Rhodomonas_salina.2
MTCAHTQEEGKERDSQGIGTLSAVHPVACVHDAYLRKVFPGWFSGSSGGCDYWKVGVGCLLGLANPVCTGEIKPNSRFWDATGGTSRCCIDLVAVGTISKGEEVLVDHRPNYVKKQLKGKCRTCPRSS